MRIGIVGCGMVGEALMHAFMQNPYTSNHQLKVYDKYKNCLNAKNLEDLFDTDLIFLCLPTPTGPNGQDISAIQQTLSILDPPYRGVVALKSTVLPGTTKRLSELHPNLRIVHNPEFLREAHAADDIRFGRHALVGGFDETAVLMVAEFWSNFYESIFNKAIYRNPATTEYAKYFHNVFLSAKVSICNDFYELCEADGVNYDLVMEAAQTTGKIGDSHTDVPGPDGRIGYGGSCFPKDILALSQHATKLDVPFEAIHAIMQANQRRRPNG